MFSRTEKVIGKEALELLAEKRVAVFGVGGVGSYTVEALARTGIGRLVLIDKDVIDESNINRQIHALTDTVGRSKVEVMKERVLRINPNIEVETFQMTYLPRNDNSDELVRDDYDYIVDAIDMVTGKIGLVMAAKEKDVPIISCMGTGNKLDPARFMVADIYDTSVCPLAKVMRKELKRRGIEKLKVVYSDEEPLARSKPPGSVAFVPSVAGLIIASEVVKDLIRGISD